MKSGAEVFQTFSKAFQFKRINRNNFHLQRLFALQQVALKNHFANVSHSPIRTAAKLWAFLFAKFKIIAISSISYLVCFWKKAIMHGTNNGHTKSTEMKYFVVAKCCRILWFFDYRTMLIITNFRRYDICIADRHNCRVA